MESLMDLHEAVALSSVSHGSSVPLAFLLDHGLDEGCIYTCCLGAFLDGRLHWIGLHGLHKALRRSSSV